MPKPTTVLLSCLLVLVCAWATPQPVAATPTSWSDSELWDAKQQKYPWCNPSPDHEADLQVGSRFEACRFQYTDERSSVRARELSVVKTSGSSGATTVDVYLDIVTYDLFEPETVYVSMAQPSCVPAGCTVTAPSGTFGDANSQRIEQPLRGMAHFTFTVTHSVPPGSITRPVVNYPLSVGVIHPAAGGMDWYVRNASMSTPQVRCDQALPGNSRTGCVVEQSQPTFYMNGTSSGGYPQVAAHIQAAQTVITAGTATPLHRVTDTARDTNRRNACSRVRTVSRAYNSAEAQLMPDKFSCDEYPFASSAEGGQNTSIGTPSKAYYALTGVPALNPASKLSIALVNNRENSVHGSLLGGFYADNRILPAGAGGLGSGDGYYARIATDNKPGNYPQPSTEPTNRRCELAEAGASAAASRAVAVACAAEGSVSYTWGGGHGSTPGMTYGFYDGVDPASKFDGSVLGFDCSGFARWAWWRATGNDFLGSSTAQDQMNKLSVNPSLASRVDGTFDLLPGDLLYFGSAGKIHHVAVYLGGWKIVEARQSGTKVMVSSFSSHSDFYAAYRPAVSGSPTPDNSGNAYVWGSAVNVRAAATTTSAKVASITQPSLITVQCQTAGERVTYANGVSDYWSKVPALGGYVSNVFIRGPEFLPGIPLCAGSSGPAPPDPGKFKVWDSGVNVRADATIGAAKVGVISAPTYVDVVCQKAGSTVTDGNYSSSWWSKISSPAGYVSNVYLVGAAKLEGVPECSGSSPSPGSGLFTIWATDVAVRAIAASTGAKVGELDSPATVAISCQTLGESITDGSYNSRYWSKTTIPSGYVSNVYIKGDAQLAGVPLC